MILQKKKKEEFYHVLLSQLESHYMLLLLGTKYRYKFVRKTISKSLLSHKFKKF